MFGRLTCAWSRGVERSAAENVSIYYVCTRDSHWDLRPTPVRWRMFVRWLSSLSKPSYQSPRWLRCDNQRRSAMAGFSHGYYSHNPDRSSCGFVTFLDSTACSCRGQCSACPRPPPSYPSTAAMAMSNRQRSLSMSDAIRLSPALLRRQLPIRLVRAAEETHESSTDRWPSRAQDLSESLPANSPPPPRGLCVPSLPDRALSPPFLVRPLLPRRAYSPRPCRARHSPRAVAPSW